MRRWRRALFGSADLCALQHPVDPCSYLPFPNPDDQQTATPASDEAPPDAAAAPADDPSSDDLTADDDGVEDYPVNRLAVENAAGSPPSCPTATPFV
jgi:hypothetical protein